MVDALHAICQFLGELLEVIGGEAAVQINHAIACGARDIPQSQVAAATEAFLGEVAENPEVRAE
jgi:hypothetical protein